MIYSIRKAFLPQCRKQTALLRSGSQSSACAPDSSTASCRRVTTGKRSLLSSSSSPYGMCACRVVAAGKRPSCLLCCSGEMEFRINYYIEHPKQPKGSKRPGRRATPQRHDTAKHRKPAKFMLHAFGVVWNEGRTLLLLASLSLSNVVGSRRVAVPSYCRSFFAPGRRTFFIVPGNSHGALATAKKGHVPPTKTKTA